MAWKREENGVWCGFGRWGCRLAPMDLGGKSDRLCRRSSELLVWGKFRPMNVDGGQYPPMQGIGNYISDEDVQGRIEGKTKAYG